MNFNAIQWTLATGDYESKPLLLRFRQFPDTFDKSAFPIRLNVFWNMSEPSKVGLPTQQESRRLESFENRLVEAVEIDCQSVLSIVLTCNGQREFVFHTSNSDSFLEKLSSMPQERERYPIDIRQYSDPYWKYDESVTLTLTNRSVH